MQAIIITQPGGPQVLQPAERPVPAPGPGEVLIRVAAAGVNYPDTVQRKGHYPAPAGVPADIPGLEVAGTVAAVGPGVEQWQPDDCVCALVAGGGYAEYVVVPAGQCLPTPPALTDVEAASLPETFFTVWTNVFDRGRFKPGETVLFHGGTSGIGVAGIQMVRAMGGTPYATAGTDEKCARAEALGAAKCFNYRTQDWAAELKALEPTGVDIVLDMVGGDYTRKNLSSLAVEGRLCIINAMQGRVGEADLMKIMVKRLTITGSTLRAREPEFKADIAYHLETQIWPLIEAGHIKPVVYQTFPLAQAAQAHALIESGQHIGKVVLEINTQ